MTANYNHKKKALIRPKLTRPTRQASSHNSASSPQIEEIHLKKGQIIKITPDMVIGDVILAYPETLPVLQEIGVHCAGCYIAKFESIQEGISRHGLNPKKVCKMLNDTIKHVRRSSPPPKSRKR